MGPNLSSYGNNKQQPAAMKKHPGAYAAGDGDYWKGVVGLAKGLRRVRSAYPLVVAVLPDVPEDHRRWLRAQGCLVREIQPVYPPDCSQTRFAMAYYVIDYSKLRIWELLADDGYERMVYLDADIQVFEGIDGLFGLDRGRFYAVMDCFCEKTRRHTPQHRIGYCQQCPERVAWPEDDEELGPPPPACSCTSPAGTPPGTSWTRSPSPRPRPSPSRTSSTPSSATHTPSRPSTTSCSPCCGGTRTRSNSTRSRSCTTAQRVPSRGGTLGRSPTWSATTSRCW